jgi:hypothetical protein
MNYKVGDIFQVKQDGSQRLMAFKPGAYVEVIGIVTEDNPVGPDGDQVVVHVGPGAYPRIGVNGATKLNGQMNGIWYSLSTIQACFDKVAPADLHKVKYKVTGKLFKINKEVYEQLTEWEDGDPGAHWTSAFQVGTLVRVIRRIGEIPDMVLVRAEDDPESQNFAFPVEWAFGQRAENVTYEK